MVAGLGTQVFSISKPAAQLHLRPDYGLPLRSHVVKRGCKEPHNLYICTAYIKPKVQLPQWWCCSGTIQPSEDGEGHGINGTMAPTHICQAAMSWGSTHNPYRWSNVWLSHTHLQVYPLSWCSLILSPKQCCGYVHDLALNQSDWFNWDYSYEKEIQDCSQWIYDSSFKGKRQYYLMSWQKAQTLSCMPQIVTVWNERIKLIGLKLL